MSSYAVLIPWVETEHGRSLLFEVRSELVKQPGEVCFPGGRVEAGETVIEAAVRETCEELGILREKMDVISELDALAMSDGRVVHPIEANLNITGIEELSLSAGEVNEVFLLPEEWLRSHSIEHYELAATSDEDLPEKLAEYLTHYGEYRHKGSTDYLEYDGHAIWGLTARILKRLTI